MKEIKDYLHLYLGCEVIGEYEDRPNKGYLTGVHGEYEAEIQFFEEDGFNVFEHPEYNNFIKVKPILRPLGDMSEEEKAEMMEQKHKYDTGNPASHELTDFAYRLHWALSKHFDLFGLIEAGLAIDKSELQEAQFKKEGIK